MWLLSTDRAELHYFSSTDLVPGGYAILSHVWDKTELSFQDINKLRDDCELGRTCPRDHASAKVRESCKLAESHGYRWIWIDTCCIDKTSSAELSEAINSMFIYYSRAEICYAYLRDVPHDCDLEAENSAFRRSVWHTRGWTLQELIAPNFLLLVAQDWSVLSSKADLADLLQEITNVPVGMLLRAVSAESFSVAQRMSWAATRRTTRVEDEAYSLMGLFGISMATIYGEGRNAFQRLQEEIMKQSVDTTLFAWGGIASPGDLEDFLPFEGLFLHDNHYLLASSPSAFVGSGKVTFSPAEVYQHVDDEDGEHMEMFDNDVSQILGGIPEMSLRPYGVHARIPVFQVGEFTIAVVCCIQRTEHLGLIMSLQSGALDHSRPLYRLGALKSNRQESNARLVRLGKNLAALNFNGNPVDFRWEEIHFSHRPRLGMSPKDTRDRIPVIEFNHSTRTPFRVPEHMLRTFVASARPQVDFEGMLFEDRDPHTLWKGSTPRTFCFFLYPMGVRAARCFELFVHLGRCIAPYARPEDVPIPEPPLGPHWATVVMEEFDDESAERMPYDSEDELPGHDCESDHIEDWENLERKFVFPVRGQVDGRWATLYSLVLTLSFKRCAINPAQTMVMSMILSQDSDREPVFDRGLQTDSERQESKPDVTHSP